MKTQFSLLAMVAVVACGPTTETSSTTEKATPIEIVLPANVEWLEGRHYEMSLPNAEDYDSIEWQQTGGTDYGWTVDEGSVSLTIPTLPIGYSETVSFDITATTREGEVSQDTLNVTVRSNDRVLYLVKDDNTGNNSLWVYNAETGTNLQLSGGGDFTSVVDFTLSPDGSYIAYKADEDVDNRTELWVVPVTGGDSQRANADFLQVGADVSKFVWMNDSSGLIYRIDDAVDGQYQMFHFNLEDDAITRMSQDLVDGGSVLKMSLAPDDSAVAYVADAELDGTYEAYAVDLATQVRSKLNGTLIAGGDVSTSLYWAPDASRIAFLADSQADGDFNLYGVDPDGTDRVMLNGELVAGGDVTTVAWLADSSGVLFRSDDQVNSEYNLYHALADGSDLIQINDTLVGSGAISTYTLNADQTHVLYRGDVNTDGMYELYSANLNGGERVRLNDTLDAGEDVFNAWWVGSSNTIVYRADSDVDGRYELYAVHRDGSDRRKISKEVGEADNANMSVNSQVRFSSDGTQVLYIADQYIDGIHTLFRADLQLDTVNDILQGVSAQADVEDYDLSPDNSTVLSRLEMPSTAVDLMLSAPDGSNNLKVNNSENNADYVDVGLALWSPDSSRVLYVADELSENYGLYVADPSDGSRLRVDELADESQNINFAEWIN